MKMILKLIKRALCFTFFIVTLTSSAQSYSWAANKKFSLSCYGWRTSISTVDNSVCVTGNFFNPYQATATSMGGFVIKYDASGNLQWEKKYYSTYQAAYTLNATDNQGNVFVSGFAENLQFEDTIFSGFGTFLLKYDPDGNLLFSYHEPNTQTRTICIDQFNNIYLAGTFNTDQDSVFNGQPFKRDTFIAKYNQYGNFLWVKHFFCFGHLENAFDMCLDAQGNIYSTGVFSQFGDNYITDSIQLINTGALDGFVAKYNSSAKLQWVKTIKGEGGDVCKSIGVSPAGDVYIGGYYGSSINSDEHYFDTITVNGNLNNGADIFIAKYNASGNCQWVRTAGGNGIDYVRNLYVDNNGDAFITGYFGPNGSDSAVFGNQTFYCPDGTVMYLAQYDSNGNLKWAQASHGGQGYAEDLIGNGQGDLYVTGGFLGNWNFGTLSLVGDEEMFLIKLNYNSIATSNNGIENKGECLQIYPNPANGIFTLNYVSTKPKEAFSLALIIRNTIGQTVYTENLKEISASFIKQINLSFLPKGIYFLELNSNTPDSTQKKVEVKKIVLQ